MIYAIIAGIVQAVYIIASKELFLKKRISVNLYTSLLFMGLFLVSLAIFPYLGKIDPGFWQTKYILLFILMVLVVVAWNCMYYKALNKEKITEFELIAMTYPLITVFLATILLPFERSWQIIIAGLVASMALILSHIRKHHLRFGEIDRLLLLAIFLMAIEAVLDRYLLEVLSPVALYCFRTGFVALILPFVLKPNYRETDFKKVGTISLLSISAVCFFSLQLYSYQKIGVAFTVLIMLIQPILVFIYAMHIKGEKFQIKKVIAAIIIVISIIYAYLTKV